MALLGTMCQVEACATLEGGCRWSPKFHTASSPTSRVSAALIGLTREHEARLPLLFLCTFTLCETILAGVNMLCQALLFALLALVPSSFSYLNIGRPERRVEVRKVVPVPWPRQVPSSTGQNYSTGLFSTAGSFPTLLADSYHGVFADDLAIATCTPCVSSNASASNIAAGLNSTTASCTPTPYFGVFRPDTAISTTPPASYCFDPSYSGPFQSVPNPTYTPLPCCSSTFNPCNPPSNSTSSYTGVFRPSSSTIFASNFTNFATGQSTLPTPASLLPGFTPSATSALITGSNAPGAGSLPNPGDPATVSGCGTATGTGTISGSGTVYVGGVLPVPSSGVTSGVGTVVGEQMILRGFWRLC